MITEIIYLAAVLLILGFLIYSSIYLILLSYSWFKGAPYVATELAEIHRVIDAVGLKKGEYFYDLGCGDGRVVRYAVKKYQVHGIGIDVNPILILLARLRSLGISKDYIHFLNRDILKTDLTQATTIYMYLLPSIIKRLEHTLATELSAGTTIISYAFKIPYLEDYLVKTHKGPIFSAYIYIIQY